MGVKSLHCLLWSIIIILFLIILFRPHLYLLHVEWEHFGVFYPTITIRVKNPLPMQVSNVRYMMLFVDEDGLFDNRALMVDFGDMQPGEVKGRSFRTMSTAPTFDRITVRPARIWENEEAHTPRFLRRIGTHSVIILDEVQNIPPY